MNLRGITKSENDNGGWQAALLAWLKKQRKPDQTEKRLSSRQFLQKAVVGGGGSQPQGDPRHTKHPHRRNDDQSESSRRPPPRLVSTTPRALLHEPSHYNAAATTRSWKRIPASTTEEDQHRMEVDGHCGRRATRKKNQIGHLTQLPKIQHPTAL